jgi:hypothetical protein
MILALRQRHRRIVIALGIILPVAFVVGVGLRKAPPLRATSPLLADLQNMEVQLWERGDLFLKVPVRVRLFHTPAYSTIQFLPGPAFAKPDLLAYWVAGGSAITDVLPSNAKLLGGFNSSIRLQLPEDTRHDEGVLVLYSLADQQIVDVSQPVRFNYSTK